MTKRSSLRAARLLLVYNADGGILNMIKDGVWKIASPSTYPCSLCAITYGPVAMHSEWRRFLESLPLEVVFHHKDDFSADYPGHDIALPAILLANGDEHPRVLVSQAELDATADTIELIEIVEQRLTDQHESAPGFKALA
ncbi:hypothetical protein [uncultured Erythrobacter sp.]|uniref:hypothetical protein n=1 Tax=uncultured Erythrobacter sp. TaxID=263913 RepID=UPI00260873B8|nr:hypothetical protein [uncultured Erythrobacter sp.]